jgi:hypothetical protein
MRSAFSATTDGVPGLVVEAAPLRPARHQELPRTCAAEEVGDRTRGDVRWSPAVPDPSSHCMQSFGGMCRLLYPRSMGHNAWRIGTTPPS